MQVSGQSTRHLRKKGYRKPKVSGSRSDGASVVFCITVSRTAVRRSRPLLFAEQPGQTINVDLCFVPAEHQAEVKLPAVSGSSGKLVVQLPKAEPVFADYPGSVPMRVFLILRL